MIRHLVNLLLHDIFPPSRLFGFRRFLWRLAGIEMGRNVAICGGGWIYGRGTVKIGHNSWLSPGTVIHSHEDAPIIIGENCDVGPGVQFVTGSHEIAGANRRAGKGTARPIAIGDGCWIGAGTLILGGCTIGKGSVVAAASLVRTDFPENSLVAGVPAKKRRVLDRHIT